MTQGPEQLRQFVLENLENIYIAGASSSSIDFPDFELNALDYLEFAENELTIYQGDLSEAFRVPHLINCVAHLKRSMDCQVDTFFHVSGLSQLFNKRNLKFEKKLEFLQAVGLISPRSLVRFTSIRNRIEHDFELPKLGDIEVYYDLTAAFVATLQQSFYEVASLEYIEFVVENSDQIPIGSMYCSYNFDEPSIRIEWSVGDKEETLTATTKSIEEFTYFFKVAIMLQRLDSYSSRRYVRSRISS